MRRYLQQGSGELVTGLLLGFGGMLVYLLTLEPTVSFWDCGEFIAVSSLLEVGHPPGAPFYQLLAHVFSWLAGGIGAAVAMCCNALSTVAGGLTVSFLYWSIMMVFDLDADHDPDWPTRLKPWTKKIPAAVGALCYLFCDTAWFSATESEVYSLAMLIASVMVWAALRWYRCTDSDSAPRWLMLIALLTGLGVCTHLLTLLTLPTVLLIVLYGIWGRKEGKGLAAVVEYLCVRRRHIIATGAFLLFFFIIGLSPYLIIPIRASAGTPINQMREATAENFHAYVSREQYEHAPLYPRMWRHHKDDDVYASSWSGGDTGVVGNVSYYLSYQLTYMYLRYLMWNFAGRYNDRQGFGSPQNGQFITGLPPVDRLLVGTGAKPPDSLPMKGHNVYYLLPLVIGLVGIVASSHRGRRFWAVMSLFLMGGMVLSFYLNHPAYEPRERDYAYILSFYAFCMFIALGIECVASTIGRHAKKPYVAGFLMMSLALPVLMACQNWDDHDRSHRYIARDAAANILQSCDESEEGTVLFTYGDNDTFPLWYVQSVEGVRSDIRVENIGLMGWSNFVSLLDECIEDGRPVYFTHYAVKRYGGLFNGQMQLEGYCSRLMAEKCDSVAAEPFYRHVMDSVAWRSLEGVYVDEVGCRFLEYYWEKVVLLAENLTDQGRREDALAVLGKTQREIPLKHLQNPRLIYNIGEAWMRAGDSVAGGTVYAQLHERLMEQMEYYKTLSPAMRAAMPYTIEQRRDLLAKLGCRSD